jgi:tetratricopeptide (TPR) repeat protein
MKRCVYSLLAAAAVSVLILGCEMGQVKPTSRTATVAPEYQRRVQMARRAEQAGDVKGALEQWEIAETLEPNSKEAQTSVARLNGAVKQKADEAYRAGMDAWNKGIAGAAEHNFLIALRLDPDRKDILAKLTETPQRPEGILVHRVAPGETLSIIAQKYYGNLQDYAVLARYNRIDDPAKLKVGQQILIPGVKPAAAKPVKPAAEASQPQAETAMAVQPQPETVAASQPQTEAEALASRPQEAMEMEAGSESFAPSPGESEEQLQIESYYVAALNLRQQKDYESASFELQKVINADPEYKNARNLYKESEYLLGRERLAGGNLSGAYQCFKNVADLDPNYKDVSKRLDVTLVQLKDFHYRKGIKLYKQEKLEEALKEWKVVYDLDPNYKKVDYYIQRCEQILKRLKELKSSGT